MGALVGDGERYLWSVEERLGNLRNFVELGEWLLRVGVGERGLDIGPTQGICIRGRNYAELRRLDALGRCSRIIEQVQECITNALPNLVDLLIDVDAFRRLPPGNRGIIDQPFH